MTSEPTILDGHAHAASSRFFPRSFIAGMVDNAAVQLASRGIRSRRSAIMELYSSRFEDHLCDELVQEMDSAGFTESVLLLPDFTYALEDCTLTIAEMFERHQEILARHPGRFRVFAGVDPRWGADGIALFERGIREYGFHGMKIYPPCGYRPDERALYPFYELCARYRVPVLTHTGASSPALRFDTSQPIMIDGPARDFPGVDFILAHGSVHYADEAAMMCSHRPNVYLDVSGFSGSSGASLRALFARGINHKLIFGTDWPVFRLQGTQATLFARSFVDQQPFPEDYGAHDRAAFFSRTLLRLLDKRSER